MSSRKRTAVAAGVAVILLLFVAARVGLRDLFGNPWPDFARWLLWSRSYKAAVLAQQEADDHELQHIEWDGWGWAIADNYVYVVFDPTDSLAYAADSRQPGKFAGIPCDVVRVKRLEKKWYTVRFYTDRVWRDGC